MLVVGNLSWVAFPGATKGRPLVPIAAIAQYERYFEATTWVFQTDDAPFDASVAIVSDDKLPGTVLPAPTWVCEAKRWQPKGTFASRVVEARERTDGIGTSFGLTATPITERDWASYVGLATVGVDNVDLRIGASRQVTQLRLRLRKWTFLVLLSPVGVEDAVGWSRPAAHAHVELDDAIRVAVGRLLNDSRAFQCTAGLIALCDVYVMCLRAGAVRTTYINRNLLATRRRKHHVHRTEACVCARMGALAKVPHGVVAGSWACALNHYSVVGADVGRQRKVKWTARWSYLGVQNS